MLASHSFPISVGPKMKLTKDEFRSLQQQWYQKLADSGFKDIERIRNDDLFVESPAFCLRHSKGRDEFDREMDAEYYRRLGHAVNDDNVVFRTEIDRYIMVRYSEGAKIVKITKELFAQGISRDRKALRAVIRKYEMAWGIVEYSRSQLHLKKMP